MRTYFCPRFLPSWRALVAASLLTGLSLSAAAAVQLNYSDFISGAQNLRVDLAWLHPDTGAVRLDSPDNTTVVRIDWGDGTVSNQHFFADHTYTDRTRDYVISVTWTNPQGVGAEATQIIRFANEPYSVAPHAFNPNLLVSMPDPVRIYRRNGELILWPEYTPFTNIPAGYTKAVIEHVCSAALEVQYPLCEGDVYKTNGSFAQALVQQTLFEGGSSLWDTVPAAFAMSPGFMRSRVGWSSFFHELGHNCTLNMPAAYHIGHRADGPSSCVYSETMAQIFQHVTAHVLVNHAAEYGITDLLAADIRQDAYNTFQSLCASARELISGKKPFAAWDADSPEDETFPTFMCMAYEFFRQSEPDGSDYVENATRLCRFLRRFNVRWEAGYNSQVNTPEAARFRATMMVAAISYGVGQDLRPIFKSYGFTIDDAIFAALNAEVDSAQKAVAASMISVQAQPVAPGAGCTLRAESYGTPGATQWLHNGTPVAGATSPTLALVDAQPAAAGLYGLQIDAGTTVAVSRPALVGLLSTAKVLGDGEQLAADLPHPNGKTFDQVLLTGIAETISADAGQVTRTSFIDLDDDIVQVEFSGAGSLSIVLDSAHAPAEPVNYHQPGVTYMKGHAGIVIVGANETTHLSIFTVGRATAYDPTGAFNFLQAPSDSNMPVRNGNSLFNGHAETVYDGVADLAFVAIASANGKFGGIRTSNAHYFASKGFTGIYAPGVQLTGPLFVGNVEAFDNATPVLVVGSATDARITGGDMRQANQAAVQVEGLAELRFVAGSDSAGRTLPAQANRAKFVQDGVDMTVQIVVAP